MEHAMTSEPKQAPCDTLSGPVDVNPGDQAPPGAPLSGERLCPRCGGSGTLADATRCEFCGGTGKVIELVGDA